MLYKKIAKPVLFRLDPERAHHLTVDGLARMGRLPAATALIRGIYGASSYPELSQTLWGMEFRNPIGLAAGLDKNAAAVKGFASMGFGFMEVGTVTPVAQPGNERPRLFRLPPDLALINRMGFNNVGADQMAENLSRVGRYPIPIAVNIGKNKVTANEDAVSDYQICIRKLYDYASFFVVNISSPNTPGLRQLQMGDELKVLLQGIARELQIQQAKRGGAPKTVLVKIAPDLSEDEVKWTSEAIAAGGVSGIIASNTTLSREGLQHGNASQAGGLSGRPLTARSTEVIRQVYRHTGGRIPIIGSGGVFTAEDAYEKIRAGASLVEVYTALIYEGPGLVKKLVAGLSEQLRKDGFTHISQAVGTEARA